MDAWMKKGEQTDLPCRRLQIIYVDSLLSARGSKTPHSLSVGCAQEDLPEEDSVERLGKSNLTGKSDKHYLSQVVEVTINSNKHINRLYP